MKKQFISLAIAMALGAAPAFAADCGEPPIDLPNVPEGASSDASAIRTARNAVVAFSGKVDTFMTCMDKRGTILLPYMTKEQKQRWDEDLADLHDLRRGVQTEMNVAIRAYRKARQ